MLGHLALVDHRADCERDFGGATQRVALAGDGGLDASEVALGSGEQILALAGALGREIGIATDDQALTGKSGAVMLAMSRWSNSESWIAPLPSRSLIAGARNAVIQSRPTERHVFGDAGLRDHAAVADQDHMVSLKRCLSFSICVASVIGSPVLPSKTSMAMGQPSGAQSRP